jgi:phosphoglycolate phosphatase-like HAD superfamily hydrolase
MITKAIIFDFDGVIVESMNIKGQAFVSLFKEYPEHKNRILEFHFKHGGMPRIKKFEIIYKDFLKLPYTDFIGEKLSKQYSEIIYNKIITCNYVPGVEKILKSYYKKYLFFIVSGGPHNEVNNVAKQRNLDQYFEMICGSPDDKETWNKRILTTYKLKPKETIFIGDSIDDYNGIKNLGIRFIAKLTKGKANPFYNLKIESTIYNFLNFCP